MHKHVAISLSLKCKEFIDMYARYLTSLFVHRERGLLQNKHRQTWRNSKLRGVEISKSPPFSQHAFLSVKRSI